MRASRETGAGADAIVSAEAFSEASMRFCDRYALDDGAAGQRQLFKGRLATRELSTGPRISTAEMIALGDSSHKAIFPKSLSLVLTLDGLSSEFDPGNGRERMVLRPGEAAFFSFSDEVETQGHYHKGHSCKSVLIQLRPGTIGEESLAEHVEHCVRGSDIRPLGFNPRMHALSEHLFGGSFDGVVGRLLMESSVLELLAIAIGCAEDAGRDGRAVVRVSHRVQMARVRDCIVAAPAAPHTLQTLAREGGVSVSGLKAKFREIYGQSVFAFLNDVRMERAKEGLLREGWTVTQAAHFSGYAHASNFCTAFQRHFGCSPGRMSSQPDGTGRTGNA
ncbi:helix-turn-helix domain-containing protein [Xanthobacteraceae bacterium A53D]